MVSKCANPSCSTPFLYLHQGKLFRLDSGGAINTGPSFDEEAGVPHAGHRTEFFWLCNQCAATMTEAYSKRLGVTVRPRARSAAA